MNIKLITLDITEEDQLDFQIAQVDNPAIELPYQVFNSQARYKFESKEKRIVQGYFMIADLPIYRRDENGEYYVKFTKDSVRNIAQNFMRNGLTKNTNEMHQTNMFSEGVYVLESWLIDKERGTTAPTGFESLEGSWFGSMKIDNDEIWNKIKNGDFSGFSVEGNFIGTQEKDSDDRVLEAIKRIVKRETKTT